MAFQCQQDIYRIYIIKNQSDFETEFNEVYVSGLASSPWQHLDQTGARVKGGNHTTNVICNSLYTVYYTTLRKDRLSKILVAAPAME